jgi:hypothetical protein
MTTRALALDELAEARATRSSPVAHTRPQVEPLDVAGHPRADGARRLLKDSPTIAP